MRIRPRILALTACLALLGGCDWSDFENSGRFTEDFHHTYPLKPGGRLSVENFNGSIDITGWDQDSVEISGTKYGPTEEIRDAIKIDIQASADAISIRTVRPVERRGNMGAKYAIRVPRKVHLERINSSNGAIRTADLEGNARIRTSNGSVRTINLQGDLEVQTSNGTVEVQDVDGNASLKTSNGRVKAERVRGGVEAYTSNGSVTLELTSSRGSRPIKVETSNGSVELRLEAARPNEVRASTSNGSITLRMPSDTAARVRAHTSNSSISTDFSVETQGTVSKNHLEGTIGPGGPLLDLSTSNGSIRLLKL